MLALPRTRLGPRTRQSRRRGAALRARRGCFGPITCGIRKLVPPGQSVHLHAGAGAFGFGTRLWNDHRLSSKTEPPKHEYTSVRWRAIKALRAVVKCSLCLSCRAAQTSRSGGRRTAPGTLALLPPRSIAAWAACFLALSFFGGAVVVGTAADGDCQLRDKRYK
jgi:hypothetical protein